MLKDRWGIQALGCELSILQELPEHLSELQMQPLSNIHLPQSSLISLIFKEFRFVFSLYQHTWTGSSWRPSQTKEYNIFCMRKNIFYFKTLHLTKDMIAFQQEPKTASLAGSGFCYLSTLQQALQVQAGPILSVWKTAPMFSPGYWTQYRDLFTGIVRFITQAFSLKNMYGYNQKSSTINGISQCVVYTYALSYTSTLWSQEEYFESSEMACSAYKYKDLTTKRSQIPICSKIIKAKYVCFDYNDTKIYLETPLKYM